MLHRSKSQLNDKNWVPINLVNNLVNNEFSAKTLII